VSRAFVKEPDSDAPEALPERPVSPHPNPVTREGLAAIEAELSRLDAAHAVAVRGDDKPAIAQTARDLRYWTARRASAEVVGEPDDSGTVQFGSRVTLLRDDGRRQAFRIVGEDEAEPTRGTLSHVSPLARALFGKTVGDVAPAGGGEVEILKID
jgi:transcription elongation GreA/GreB family factor